MDTVMVKRVLMIAFHFPPMRGSSGIQRTLKFARYLPQFGWQPLVLTANPRAYISTGQDQIAEIAADTPVRRAFALDTSRHLSIKGRYLTILALPDRWISWFFGAIPSGMQMMRQYKPKVIWSTYPIATAHLIGYALHCLTKVPWIADFRDPMTDQVHPENRLVKRIYQLIEKRTLTSCQVAVFASRGALLDYKARFPLVPASRFALIENGYCEEDFMISSAALKAKTTGHPLKIVHSGVIYPLERNPVPFFEALSEMLQEGLVGPTSLKIVLRASGHDSYLEPLIKNLGIKSIVELAPPISHRHAIEEMMNADGLLIIQASNCNSQIPAKLYECMRAQRPIFALTDSSGDTAACLKLVGIDSIASLESRSEIAIGLKNFLGRLSAGTAPIADMEVTTRFSRYLRTAELASLLQELCEPQKKTSL